VDILLWLLPAAVVTVAAMLVVGWVGREERGQVDRETAARRLGEALSREPRNNPGYAVPRRTPERSTGVALRTSRQRPVLLQGESVQLPPDPEGVVVYDAGGDEQAGKGGSSTPRGRRAS